MFGELRLKETHGSLITFCPPEFPLWTTSAVSNNSDSSPTGSATGDQSSMAVQTTSQLSQSNNSDEPVITSDVSVKGGNTGFILNSKTSNLTTQDNDDAAAVNRQLMNPVALKESCCQKLVQCCVISKPPTLFSICVDYISWHTNEHYKCSMLLPRHMNTATFMMELLDHKPEQTSPHVKIKQVKLYDNLLIDPRVKQYLLEQAKSWNYQVVIQKLSDQTISEWSDRQKPTWQDIDPYSGLEDIGSSDADKMQYEEVSSTRTHYSL